MEAIRSLQNPRVKDAVRLRDRRGRQRQRRIIIDGKREIRRALDAGVAIVEVFVCPTLGDHESRDLVDRLGMSSVTMLEVTPPVFEKLAFGQRCEGLVAVAETPELDIRRLALPGEALIAVLEGVEKPGNVGAVLRSADAAGVAALIVADGGTDVFNPNAIRASLGAIFTVPVAAASSSQTLAWLLREGFSIFAARVDGTACYTDVCYRGRSAVVLGSEADGLTDVWRGDRVTPIRLPMCGVVDSLNVSAAAAVLFFEAWRQRSAGGTT